MTMQVFKSAIVQGVQTIVPGPQCQIWRVAHDKSERLSGQSMVVVALVNQRLLWPSVITLPFNSVFLTPLEENVPSFSAPC